MPTQQSREQLALNDFRDTMAHLVSGVAVVTARSPRGLPCGLLVSSITSYGTNPATVLLAIDQAARTYEALRQSEVFGVHLLAADQIGLAEIFAGHRDDKFADVEWKWDGDVPRLDGGMAYLHCRTAMFMPFADHAITVGEMTGIHTERGDPLIYFKRRLDWRLS